MSSYMLEKVLWDLGQSPERAARFKEDAALFLSQYRLTPEEVRALKELDVRELVERKASPLLTLMTWTVVAGPESIPVYMQRMNAAKS